MGITQKVNFTTSNKLPQKIYANFIANGYGRMDSEYSTFLAEFIFITWEDEGFHFKHMINR